MAKPDDGVAPVGLPAPQQARSRAALQRLLVAAEEVLINDGIDEFTIGRVAERAGVSVGGVYRRFTGKGQLIDAVRQNLLARLDQEVADALAAAKPSAAGMVCAFAGALARIYAVSGPVVPAVLSAPRPIDTPEHVAAAITGLQDRFLAAIDPHREQIRHPDPVQAATLAFRTIIAAGVHRAAVIGWWPDGLDWPEWGTEIAAMAADYLTVEGTLR